MVRLHYPEFDSSFADHQLVLTGPVRPSAMSDEYRVRIEYRWNRIPRVFAIEPEVLPNEFGEEVPHRYTDADHPLCLFHAKGREWSGHDLLSTTIIPWTSEWLFFYEVWRATRVWLGGGIEHAPLDVPREEVEPNA